MAYKVSIIIAVGMPGAYLDECVEHCLSLDYLGAEIIVLPDGEWTPPDASIRVIPTGKVRPAEKRDRGAREATGEIVAIIDDDAYPCREWLSRALRHFDDPDVAAVGGPGVTPPDDNLRQKISGWIYESPMVSGGFTYRYRPGAMRDVDDYPTSSLLIRREDFLAVGGFDTGYWPGEDTILCLKLTRQLGKRIVYDPDVLVHHHRREIFGGHLRQIKSYALHRGFFVRKFPETSLKPSYFVPSVFTLFSLFGWMSVFLWEPLLLVWFVIMDMYLLLALWHSLRTLNPFGILGIITGTFLTHITYGIWFMLGLVSTELHD
ncbi:glycosyltransferase [Candidatus Latescibacterota bacterium]